MVTKILLVLLMTIGFWGCAPNLPPPVEVPTRPTSLILVHLTSSNDVVLRYVRGEQLHPDGTYVSKDQPVGLRRQSSVGNELISVPSTVLFPRTDRIYVARAVYDTTPNETSIYIVDSGYATMLAVSQSRLVISRPLRIDSAVLLTYLNDRLLLFWREGNILKLIRSDDGETWSAIEDAFRLPDGGLFALWSEGPEIYIAYTTDNGMAIRVQSSTDAIAFNSTAMNAPGLAKAVTGISIATKDNHVFVAYCDVKAVKIMRATKGSNFSNFTDVFTAPLNDPNYHIHAVTVHPSPYGWALQYVASFLSQNGISYTIFGLRSDDGLDYSGTVWTYSSDAWYLGPTSMATTPVPMPWIVKTHDSGLSAEAVYNFVITGDGFTYEEKNTFMEAARTMTANITNRAPFYYNGDLFNVWVVNTFSNESGFDVSVANDDKNTIFDGYRGAGTMVITRQDGIRHARRVVTGDETTNNFYGFMFFNPPEGELIGILPWDLGGVPMPYHKSNSLISIHEYSHTHAGAGGLALGDHERRNQPSTNNNKSFDRTFSAAGSHEWQHWFTFGGPAASRLIDVTDVYRVGLIDWVANGNDRYSYWASHFAYSEDPASPHYVDALSLFNVGLWESEYSDVADLSATPQYSALRACSMNSQIHHAQIYCPICSEIIVKHLQTVAGIVNESAGRPFDVAAFQGAAGSYLEFQFKNAKVCNESNFPPLIDLENLIVVNGHTIATSDIFTYESEDFILHLIGRIDLSPWVTPGLPATVTFRQRSSTDGETHLWIPGIQIVNGKGARYPMQPLGTSLIERLHQKHAPECDYEYWNLADDDFVLTFTPNT